MPAIVYGADDRMFVPVPVPVQSSAYSAPADANVFVPLDTTAGAVTVTLPSAPMDRAVAAVQIVKGTNGATVACSGSDVFMVAGGATTASLTGVGTSGWWQYSATAGIWYEVAGGSSGSSGTIPITQGGTGQTNATAAFNALSPTTTLGDVLSNDGTNDVRVSGNTAATRKFLRQTGTGSVSALPAWDTIASGDLPVASGSQAGAVSTGSQTLAGAKTFSSAVTVPAPPVLSAFTPAVATAAVTVTGVTVATLLASGLTVPASGLAAGQLYRMVAWGTMTTGSGTQTFTFNLLWGGVGGTSLLSWGASNPNSSGAVTAAPFQVTFEIAALSATSIAVSGWIGMNFFFSTLNQQVTTVSNASSEQFAVAVAPSASAASVTANGAYCQRLV